jgi:ubiquinone/menaquinone biosynthesis C-methylase UbiE
MKSSATKSGSAEDFWDKASIREGYDTYMSRFFDLLTVYFFGPIIMKSHRVLLESVRRRCPAILDVGCGTGTLLDVMAREDYGDYLVGIDFSRNMLRNAKGKITESGSANRVDLVCADAECLPFRMSSFSAITCTGVLRFFPSPEVALREDYRVLEPGGRLAMREMAGPKTPSMITHFPLPFKKSFVVWRLWPKLFLENMLDDAGFTRIRISGKEVIPHFVFALGPPFRQYVFTGAEKPS